MTDVEAAVRLTALFRAWNRSIDSEPFPVFDLPAVLEGQRQ